MDNSSKGDTIINNKTSNVSLEIDGKALVVLMQILLIVLKIFGLIDGAWWVILLPTIIPLAGVAVMVFIILIAAIISPSFRKDVMKKKEKSDKIDIEINGEENDD